MHYKPVTEKEYVEMEQSFDAGQYVFEVNFWVETSHTHKLKSVSQIEDVTFSMADYDKFVDSIQDQIVDFKRNQAEAVARVEAQCVAVLTDALLSSDCPFPGKLCYSRNGGNAKTRNSHKLLTRRRLHLRVRQSLFALKVQFPSDFALQT